jgi:hypothetical protein
LPKPQKALDVGSIGILHVAEAWTSPLEHHLGYRLVASIFFSTTMPTILIIIINYYYYLLFLLLLIYIFIYIYIYPLVNKHSYGKWPSYSWFTY